MEAHFECRERGEDRGLLSMGQQLFWMFDKFCKNETESKKENVWHDFANVSNSFSEFRGRAQDHRQLHRIRESAHAGATALVIPEHRDPWS